jgi:RNA polymerase sigma-70 factor (ECF subfamily)
VPFQAQVSPPVPEWVSRLHAGDERAFEALFRAFAPGLVAYSARLVRSAPVAEELVQDLFLALWRGRERVAAHGEAAAYLYAAARNRALSHLARERTAARRGHGPLSLHGGGSRGADVPLDAADPHAPREDDLLALLDLQEAVAALPARCRLVFTMQRQHGMSYGEVAQALGLSVKTVEAQMGRALKALRAHLGAALAILLALATLR